MCESMLSIDRWPGLQLSYTILDSPHLLQALPCEIEWQNKYEVVPLCISQRPIQAAQL